MSQIIIQPSVKFQVTLVLTEQECRALDGLTGYDMDDFLRVFYTHMGKHYLMPHEAALRDFFANVRKTIPGALSDLERVRNKMNAAFKE